MERLINPMEMARALARGDVKRFETLLYVTFFILVVYSAISGGKPEPEFSFAGGNAMMGILSVFSLAAFFVAPIILAMGEVSVGTYVKYFISLNVPLVILACVVGFVIEIAYAAASGDFAAPIVQISMTHFMLTAFVVIAQSLAMPYFMGRAIHFKKEGVKDERKKEAASEGNFLDPMKAAMDYRAGRISERGIFVRKSIFVLFVGLSVVGIFFPPAVYATHYVFSSVLFLVAFMGIPFFLNKKIDSKDFYARIAVVGASVLIDTLILAVVLGVASMIIVSGFNIDTATLYIDAFTSIVSIVLVTYAFKKYE